MTGKARRVITSFKGVAQERSSRQVAEEKRRIAAQKLIRELRKKR